MKSIYQASLEVLRQNPEGLHYKKLTKILMDEGLITTSGKTPRFSVNSIIHRWINKKGESSEIQKVEGKAGYFVATY